MKKDISIFEKSSDAVLNRLSELAYTRDIYLVDSKLPDGEKSVCVCNGITQLIMVDGSISIEERIAEIAFCLGHAILHKNLNFNIFTNKDILFRNKINMRANRFANKLLSIIK